MRALLLSLALTSGIATAAYADEKGDQAFAAGQFVGASNFCGIPRPEVNAVAKAMLDAFGVDSSGPNPDMTRFTEGVAAGTREMKEKPPATCEEVKEGFAQMKGKF